MKDKNIDKDKEIVEQLINGGSWSEYITTNQSKAIENVLSELEEYKIIAEKLEQDNFILANENLNSVGKDKIQAEIEELKSKGRIINQTLPYRGEYKYHKEIKVLEKLLKS